MPLSLLYAYYLEGIPPDHQDLRSLHEHPRRNSPFMAIFSLFYRENRNFFRFATNMKFTIIFVKSYYLISKFVVNFTNSVVKYATYFLKFELNIF
jgi:hypothetical protein